jgi:hypothetical protein
MLAKGCCEIGFSSFVLLLVLDRSSRNCLCGAHKAHSRAQFVNFSLQNLLVTDNRWLVRVLAKGCCLNNDGQKMQAHRRNQGLNSSRTLLGKRVAALETLQ